MKGKGNKKMADRRENMEVRQEPAIEGNIVIRIF